MDSSLFIATHAMKISDRNSSFDGSCSSLNIPIRKSFDTIKPKDETKFSKNIRVDGTMPISRLVENVTMALMDMHSKSYGRPNPFAKGALSQLNRVNDNCYKAFDLKFIPEEIAWEGFVRYSSIQRRKVPNSTEIKKSKVEGKFAFRVECIQVSLPKPIKGHQTLYEDEENGYQPSETHYSIDVITHDVKDVKSLDSSTRCVICDVTSYLASDIQQQILLDSLPEFPEGRNGESFRSIYQLNKRLKSGSFATVCIGTHRKDRTKVAIKCVNRKKLSPNDDVSILVEVGVVTSLNHRNICPITDFFDEEDAYYIIMPLMEGGDVFDRIAAMKHYDEGVARVLVMKMLQAISHLHEKNIAHCDLKSRNLLLHSSADDTSVVIADFGFAGRVYASQSLSRRCGTPYFVAPEILLQSGYDTKSDLWSVGVIMYSILSGGLPFTGKSHLELFKAIVKKNFDFEGPEWTNVSADAKDLICKLLVKNPKMRYSAKDSLKHPWFKTNIRLLSTNNLNITSQRLKTFNARLAFKTAILATHTIIFWRNLARRSKETSEEREARTKEVLFRVCGSFNDDFIDVEDASTESENKPSDEAEHDTKKPKVLK